VKPIHPGRILKREMTARNLSANKLALALRVPSGRITQILNGKRGISAETALRLSCYFGNSAQFWINLQSKYDLAVVEQNIGAKVIAEVQQAAGWKKTAHGAWGNGIRSGHVNSLISLLFIKKTGPFSLLYRFF
jgi:addiction module HigA family antidote